MENEIHLKMETDCSLQQPPEYREAVTTKTDTAPPGYGNELPPSYESVFGKVRQMRDESDGKADFGKKLFACLFCGIACNITVTVFMFAIPVSCLVFGSVWIYRIYGDYSNDPSSPDYCQPTLYVFAFWILTIQYIMALLAILCCCISGIVVCCLASSSS
ncbi:hypothetical protein LSH36_66g06026 [Paralvinella palmiformis]|uniref:Transmembrane protein 272-like n=1 Tax=Paralvinella palmiformis TaxID=53620 RepID=A0AAD9ND85_9ANNE|nr:hypothetical protein LSH36_66g06026 [Paralvinella palmiformis]